MMCAVNLQNIDNQVFTIKRCPAIAFRKAIHGQRLRRNRPYTALQGRFPNCRRTGIFLSELQAHRHFSGIPISGPTKATVDKSMPAILRKLKQNAATIP